MSLELLRTIFSGLTLFSIGIAYLTFRNNRDKQQKDQLLSKEKEILDQAIQSLEWAYDALTEGGENTSPPKSDRLNWLTSARHICRYKSLSKLITSETYRLICAEHEEYWRHKFYLSIDTNSLRNLDYYIDGSDPCWAENIEPTSALVVNAFANWPDGTVDPLNEKALEEFNMGDQGLKGLAGIGIRKYLQYFEERKAEMEAEHNKSSNSDAAGSAGS